MPPCQPLERERDPFVDGWGLPLKAHLRITATGKRARFQPQPGWFILLAELDTDLVLTPSRRIRRRTLGDYPPFPFLRGIREHWPIVGVAFLG